MFNHIWTITKKECRRCVGDMKFLGQSILLPALLMFFVGFLGHGFHWVIKWEYDIEVNTLWVYVIAMGFAVFYSAYRFNQEAWKEENDRNSVDALRMASVHPVAIASGKNLAGGLVVIVEAMLAATALALGHFLVCQDLEFDITFFSALESIFFKAMPILVAAGVWFFVSLVNFLCLLCED